MGIDERSIRGTRYILIGRVISAALLFIISIAVARYLGPEMYGYLSIALTAIAFISIAVDAGLNRSVQKHISQHLLRDSNTVGASCRRMLLIKIAMAGIASAIVYAVSPLFGEAFGTDVLETLMKIGALLLASTALMEYQTAVLQGYEWFKHICIAGILEAALRLLFIAMVIYSGMGVAGVMLGYASSMAVIALAFTLIIYYYAARPISKGPADWGMIRDIVNYSPPIFWSTVFFIFYTKLDILVLGYFSRAPDVGQYTLAVGLIDNLIIPITALEAAVMPIAASLYGSEAGRAGLNRLFNRTISHGLLLIMPVALGLAVVSRSFVEEIYGPDFAKTAVILIALVPLMITKVLALTNGAYLIASDEANKFMAYSFGGAILNAVLLLALIPSFGIYGAVTAKVVSHTVLTAAMLSYIVPRFKIEIDRRLMRKNLKIILSSACMAAVSYMLLSVIDGSYGLIVAIVSGAVVYPLMLHLSGAISMREMIAIARGDLG